MARVRQKKIYGWRQRSTSTSRKMQYPKTSIFTAFFITPNGSGIYPSTCSKSKLSTLKISFAPFPSSTIPDSAAIWGCSCISLASNFVWTVWTTKKLRGSVKNLQKTKLMNKICRKNAIKNLSMVTCTNQVVYLINIFQIIFKCDNNSNFSCLSPS